MIILHSNLYSFKNDETNQLIQGIKIKYLLSDTLEPSAEKTEKGYNIAECSLPVELKDKIKSVPGIYEAKYKEVVNAKRQVSLKLVDVEYLGEVC